MIGLVALCLMGLSACGVLIPDTDASGEWTAVAVIVGATLVIAVGVAVFQGSKDDSDD